MVSHGSSCAQQAVYTSRCRRRRGGIESENEKKNGCLNCPHDKKTNKVCAIQYKSFFIWCNQSSPEIRNDLHSVEDLVKGAQEPGNEKADALDSELTAARSFRSYQTTTFRCLFLWAVSSERPERTRPSWAEAGGSWHGLLNTTDVNSSFQGVW